MEKPQHLTPKKMQYSTPILVKLDADKGMGYDENCNHGSSAGNCNEYGSVAHIDCSNGEGGINHH